VKILMCAFACRPDRGSEPAAGWEFMRLAAEEHDVWVLTDRAHQTVIEASDGVGLARARFHYLDAGPALERFVAVAYGSQLRYFAWQRAAARYAARLHERVGFDLLHHVTFATDWAPAGILTVPGVPAVWGPVGGSTRMPW
jgi:hypothetical protein